MSTYYSDPKISRAETEEDLADLRHHIENIRITFPKAGYRMLHKYLERNQVKISEHKLRKVMKQFKLYLKKKRRFVRTTNSEHGFVYLAVVIDLYSRKVVGWDISKKIDGELVLGATRMAFERRGYPKGVIHHSDRGVQYLCDKHVQFLKENKFKISCAAKGNPYENAFAESFMKTLKNDQVDLFKYATIIDVIENIPEFLEEVYNKKRLHSSLNYLTPEEFEAKCIKKNRTRP